MKNQLKCILFLSFLLSILVSSSLYSQIRFEKLDSRDGLSHNRVNSIYMDQLGFIWFGTVSGINRFDGNEVKVIPFEENDPFAPTNPHVNWLKQGPGEYIWIKTSYGVFAYDVYKEKYVDISSYLCELEINNYNLTDIIKDYLGNYWFVIEDIGVKQYISAENRIYHYKDDYRDVTSIQPDYRGNMALVHMDGRIELVSIEDPRKIKTITYPEKLENIAGLTAFIDKDGDYWFYSSSSPFGLCYYSPETGKSSYMGEKELGSDFVSGVIQDELSRIIIGADHGGLTFINKDDWRLQNFRNNPIDPKSLSYNGIITIYQDKTGLVWIGTSKGGVNYYSPKSVSFNFFKQTDKESANVNDILPLVEAKNGNLWIGTDGGGLSYLDITTGKFTNYIHDPGDPRSISSDIIVSMSHAADGGLWLGTYLGGLNYFDGKKFTRFYKDPLDSNSVSDNSIWKLFLDSNNNLWVGTLKGGIDVYDSSFKKIHHFGLDNNVINSNYVTSFCEDKDGKMWVGTGYGLEVFDPATGSFTHILKEDGNSRSLSNNSILDIYCDDNNDMWIGTIYGLNRYDRAAGTFSTFYKKNGLPENLVTSILQDCEGDMWFGTYRGLSKLTYSDDSVTFENFDISDGLQGDTFNERSALQLASGNLVFGGKNGLNVFNPNDIKLNDKQNNLVFLDFYISNHQIKSGDVYDGRRWFENGLNKTKSITLKPRENSFTIEFTSLNFYQQQNTVYKYRLKGFDEEWISRSNIHRANYTNLDPGSYRFEVMDQSDKWDNNAIALNIEILTPWYNTTLARILYVVAGLLTLFLTRRGIIQKERFRAKVTHEHLEAQRLHELDLLKIKFFTNISHEFRTPLTLILTPLERLMQINKDPTYQKHVQLIYRNAKRLLTLANQLLDFRKMEANQHRLSLATGDIVDFVKSIVEFFSDLSAEKRIRLQFHSDIDSFLTSFDRDKVEKVLFNLLSNVFKFTHPGGKVQVSIRDVAHKEDIHTLRISVEDTGIGIPKERLEDIFHRFFQVDDKKTSHKNHGSGIGLAITKEFVEMHDGKIWVESELEVGSTFHVELPLKKLVDQYAYETSPDMEDEAVEPDIHQDSKETILLADDNADFRFYLKDNLKDNYNVYEVPNGKLAWKKIIHQLPDLIVTDIMMPEMNGVDLCRKVKNDPRTAHIPVILLTAHYSDEQKLQGFEAGAIEYITKPFNFEILIRAMRSAVQLQKLIHASEQRIDIKPTEIEVTSRDQQFINHAIALVETNISNPDFSVQELSRELAVSRGQLYKKTLELTGTTPIEFIRSIRIKRAADLLEKSQMNVAEVAYTVGFNNPKYFSRYFKKEYRMIPSRYAAEARNQTTN